MCSTASDTIFSAIDKKRSELHSLSKYLWENPELGFEEVKAHAAVTDFLEKHGFEVTREFKLPTAFRAEFSRGEGTNVAIICEYDALPEIGHACGHNLICEAGLAASLGVKAALETGKVNGKLTVLGSPAEESSGGKIDFINAKVFENISVALIVHPGGISEIQRRYLGLDELVVFGTPDEEGYGGKIDMIASDAFSLVDAAMMVHPFKTSTVNDLYLAFDQLFVLGTPAEEGGGGKINLLNADAFVGVDCALMSHPFSRNDAYMLWLANEKLIVLGTPAEEGGCGKKDLLMAGAFSEVESAMMVHPYAFNCNDRIYLAQTALTVKYHGKAAHAAAAPWDGRNALDAAVACYNNISLLRQQMKPKCRIHAIITNGGVKPNIIPAETEMLIYVRAPNQTELMLLSQRVVQCIIGAAKATDCETEYEFSPKGYASMNHNTVMASVYQKYAEELGTVFISAPEGRPGGSTDMGNVSQVVPSIHPTFYIGTESQIHTTAFKDQAGTDEAQEYTIVAAKALACTAVEILSDPVLLQHIRKEFEETHESVSSLSESRKASTQSV